MFHNKLYLVLIFALFVMLLSFCDEKASDKNQNKDNEKANKLVSEINNINNTKITPIDYKNLSLENIISQIKDKYKNYIKNNEIKYYNKENLSDLINGEASAYTALNFKKLLYFFLKKDNIVINVYIFDMGSPTSAFGIFSQENPEEMKLIKDSSVIVSNEDITAFYKDRFYIKLLFTENTYTLKNNSNTANSKNLMRDINKQLVEDINIMIKNVNNSLDDILSIFPKEDINIKSIVYSKDDFLGASFFHHCFSADMKIAKDKSQQDDFQMPNKIFFSIYKDDSKATEILMKYRKHIEELEGTIKKPLNLPKAGFMAEEDEWGTHYFVIYKNFVIGILGIKDENKAQELALRLFKKIDTIENIDYDSL